MSSVLHRNIPKAWPDEPIDDVLDRMADNSLTIIPVMEGESDKFPGTVTSHDVLDLMVLMDQIQDEMQRQGTEEGWSTRAVSSGDGERVHFGTAPRTFQTRTDERLVRYKGCHPRGAGS